MNVRKLLFAFVGVAALMLSVPGTALAATGGGSATSGAVTVPSSCQPAEQMTASERTALLNSGLRLLKCKVSPQSSTALGPDRSSAAPAIPAIGSVDSSFDFCNTPKGGATIACFAAELHYNSRTSFKLNTIQLEDRLCDGRSSYADVYDQNGWLGVEFVNNHCNTTVDYPTTTISDPDGVQYVYIHLYACNSTSCSDAWNSYRHYNPKY